MPKAVFKVMHEMGDKDSEELSRLLGKLSNIIYSLGKVDEGC